MAWVAVREDKRVLYNLDHFDSVAVFRSSGGQGWMVAAMQGNKPFKLAGVPDLESGENIIGELASRLSAS